MSVSLLRTVGRRTTTIVHATIAVQEPDTQNYKPFPLGSFVTIPQGISSYEVTLAPGEARTVKAQLAMEGLSVQTVGRRAQFSSAGRVVGKGPPFLLTVTDAFGNQATSLFSDYFCILMEGTGEVVDIKHKPRQ
jgi:hypothetical protein